MNPSSSTKRHALRVLVVDNDVDTADSLGLLLRLWGYDTSVCYGPAEALEAVAEVDPQAVLLDIALPGMDGYEVARRLRGRTGGNEILLIAVTGYATAADRRKAQAAGFDDHFPKPVELDALHGLLLDWEASRSARRRKAAESAVLTA